MLRRIFAGLAVVVVLAVIGLATTDSPRVWPYRNTLLYFLQKRLGGLQPVLGSSGELRGVVRSVWGRPVEGATVLVSAPDGTAYSAESDAQGRYRIADVPSGSYIPVAAAPGFEDLVLRTVLGIRVAPGQATDLELTLRPRQPVDIAPARDVRLSEAQVWEIQKPLPGRALRRELTFRVDGRSNQLTLY